MKTFYSLLAAAAFASIAQAGGSIDNTQEASKIAASASQLNGEGNYVFTNVKTGKVLSFTRSSDTTDFFPSDSSDSLAVQFSNGAARLSGGNNKCASAQWSYDVEGGVDYAAVSYACTVGTGLLTGTDTLEKTKQWWYIVPAGTTGSSSDEASNGDNSDASEDDSSDSGVSVSVGLSFGSENKADLKAARVAAAPSTSSTEPAAASPDAAASSSSDSGVSAKQAEYNQLGYWTSSSSTISLDGVDTSSVSSYDRKTWVCRHPGWWLARHQAYVTKAGHVECESDLKAYLADQQSSKRLARRSRPSHSEMAKKLVRKSQTTYHIIAVDHLQDMATRAIAHNSLTTAGGYTSTELNLWNQSDDGQLWIISQV
ncbi:hypothetical protein JCM10213_000149 [Rhodosporidiobolus nylandii]